MQSRMISDHLLRRIRTDDLRYFLAVASLGRLGPAADQLGVDTSTVSRRLRALEKTFGSALLRRSPDGFELTDLGRAVATRAQPIEAALEAVVRAARGDAEDVVSGDLRLTAPEGFAVAFAVPALTRLRERHPDLRVEVLTATRQLNLHQSGFDLAVTVGPPLTRRLFSEKLADYRLGFYASRDYLERRGSPANLDELTSHTLVFYVESLVQVGELDLSRYAPGSRSEFATTSVFAQVEATRCGAGIGLLHRFLALREPELVELTGLPEVPQLRYLLAARREALARPAAQVVREALHAEVQRRAPELR